MTVPPNHGYVPPSVAIPPAPKGRGEYRAQLAREVLTDIEDYRVDTEKLLFKARRLAQEAGDSNMAEWLSYELAGYPEPIPDDVRDIARRCGRVRPYGLWPDGNFDPSSPAEVDTILSLPRIDQVIVTTSDATKHNARVMAQMAKNARVPGGRQVSAKDAATWEQGQNRARVELIRLNGITTRVRGELHAYVTDLFHRYAYADFATSIFDRQHDALTRQLKQVAPDLLDKLPAVGARLADGTAASVEQAMATCRRLIVDFADAVSPASGVPDVDENGVERKMTQDRPKNRISGFLVRRKTGDSRRRRLEATVNFIFDRASAGMKDEIPLDEAQSLYLLTLVTIGELAELAAIAS